MVLSQTWTKTLKNVNVSLYENEKYKRINIIKIRLKRLEFGIILKLSLGKIFFFFLEIFKINATLLFCNTAKIQRQEKNLQMFIDPHHSESPIRFSHMRKKTQQQRMNHWLEKTTYLIQFH